MQAALRRAVAALRPDEREIVLLVRAEMDPRRYPDFAPITAGPVVAIAGLLAVGVLGALAAPVRLLRGLRRS